MLIQLSKQQIPYKLVVNKGIYLQRRVITMEKQPDLEAKYQKLATEYSKVRSQATVLKKAVLEEQAKSQELKEAIRKHDQTVRKHDQEMESLTFRNEQLTKRISVLQQELQVNSKKGKPKVENNAAVDVGILDEEFHKKIVENAQLLSSISDKDLEIASYRERIEWLEGKLSNIERELGNRDELSRAKLDRLQKDNEALNLRIKDLSLRHNEKNTLSNDSIEKISYWKAEADKLKAECDILRSKPTSNEKLTEYYESQLREMLETKTLCLAETKSLSAENQALKSRLEQVICEQSDLQKKLDKSHEELLTTNDNYRSQLDAMTEHLAAQNEKITQQCDEIQILRHKLSTKK